MIYFTSDQHFGHRNIIRLCNRPFASVEEMNEQLIENWNTKIHKLDNVYILGDLIFKSENKAEYYLDRLKGKKHLILGNHDKFWKSKVDLSHYFVSVNDMLKFSDGRHTLVACHYPMMSWPGGGKSFMIFGHIHNNTNMSFWPLIKNNERLLNAGVEINGYAPVSVTIYLPHVRGSQPQARDNASLKLYNGKAMVCRPVSRAFRS